MTDHLFLRCVRWVLSGFTTLNALSVCGIFASLALAFVLGLQMAGLVSGVLPSNQKPQLPALNCSALLPPASPAVQVSNGDNTSKKRLPPKQPDAKPVAISVQCEASTTPSIATPPNTADTLSALGVVVAMVTLVLTLGSTYLLTKLKEVEQLVSQERARQALDALWHAAQVDLLDYFTREQPDAAPDHTTRVGMFLRMLQSPDADQRQIANAQISAFIGHRERGPMPKVVRYYDRLREQLRQSEATRGQPLNVDFFES